MNNEELKLEAEKENVYAHYEKPLGERYLIFNEGFIAGATSKYVEKQKIQFAIEQLNQLKNKFDSLGIFRGAIKKHIDIQYTILQQKLNEL